MDTSYDLPIPRHVFSFIEQMIGYAYVPEISNLDDVPLFLEDGSEFCISHTFHPKFIDEAASRGYFPMAIPLQQNMYLMAIKLHKHRCVVAPSDLNISRTARKNSNKYRMSTCLEFDRVVQMILNQHGENWLCPLLQKAFKYIFLHPEEFKMKIFSVEVWDGDELVAGELGYAVGTIYTSLTGAFTKSGSGTVQLCALGRLLEERGFTLWDFGMQLNYKSDLGAKTIARNRWLEIVKEARESPVPDLKLDKKNGREIIDWNTKAPSKEKGEAEKPTNEKKANLKKRANKKSRTPSSAKKQRVEESSETPKQEPH